MFTIRNLSLILILAAILGSGRLYAQLDPVAARLNVDGEIEIGAGNSLRLRPVVGAVPANPEVGDLFFDGTTLSTWNGSIWQAFAEAGTLIYSDTSNTLFFYDGTSWINLGGAGGPRTVGTRIVAANNSLDKSRADYICDGTNDQEQINQAINDLPASGGAVYLLEGTYNISSSLLAGETIPGVVLDKSNTSLIGTGEMTVLKAVSGQTGFNIVSAQSVNSLFISQLRVDGNGQAGGDNGISFNSVTDSRMEKVWVENTRQSGIFLSASTNNIISNCNIPFSNIRGLILNLGSNNNIISGNLFLSNAGGGISLSSSTNNIIRENQILSSGYQGIESALSSNSIISGNNIFSAGTGSGGEGIFLGSDNSIISGNNIQNTLNGNGLVVGGSFNLISENHLQANGWNGINLSGGASNLLCGNSIWDSGAASGGWDGIRVASANFNLISSNYLSDTFGWGKGINLIGSQDNYLATNFITDPNPTDSDGYLGSTFDRRIEDNGTNTQYTDKQKMTMERRQIDISSFPSDLWQQTISGHSYLALNPTVSSLTPNIRLYKGNAAGDLLILENISSFPVDILESAVVNWQVNLGNDNNDGDGDNTKRRLNQYHTLELIWNGSKWIEIRYTNN